MISTNRGKLLTPAFLFVFVTSLVVGQQIDRKLTARELFYTPLPPAAVTKPAQTEPPTAQVPKTTSVKQAKSRPRPSTDMPARTEQQVAQTQPSRPTVVPLVQASNESYAPLALKYTIAKRMADGQYQEIDTESVFRSGDRIRITVEPNDTAYLYIIQQGSSKTWDVLFPREEIHNGSNRVERNQRYTLPSETAFYFDEQPGTEKLFILLSRKAEPDLEKLIYSIRTSEGQPLPAKGAAPASDKPLLLSKNMPKLEDEMVSRLRASVRSRDLVFEKVNDTAPGKMEKSVYIATPDRSANARVRADLELKHE